MLTHPPSLALAVSMNRVAAIRVVTVTATHTTFAKLPLLGEGVENRLGQLTRGSLFLPPGRQTVSTYWAGQLAVGPLPPRGAGTGSSLGTTDSIVGTLAAGIATEAPGSR
jgi:hypothetical protein